jgi:multiple antibiotic resistance protein
MEVHMALWTAFLLAFSALVPIVNPFGSAIVLLGLVGDVPSAAYRRLALRIAVNNVLFLGAIELLGSAILRFFGISLPIVQLGGGLVVAALGWDLLNNDDPGANARKTQSDYGEPDDANLEHLTQKAFYPFTFPVTSGPGTLVTALTMSAHISSHTLRTNILGHCGIFIAIVAVSILVYVCYAYARVITTKISSNTIHGILRVTAFILLCIGVQIAWNGLSVLLKTLLRA